MLKWKEFEYNQWNKKNYGMYGLAVMQTNSSSTIITNIQGLIKNKIDKNEWAFRKDFNPLLVRPL